MISLAARPGWALHGVLFAVCRYRALGLPATCLLQEACSEVHHRLRSFP
jgi:hypothetical protein